MHNTAATDGSFYLQINCVWHTEQNFFLPSVWTLERLTVDVTYEFYFGSDILFLYLF